MVLDRAAPHVRVAVALIMNSGLDPSYALKLRRNEISDDVMWASHSRVGNPSPVPIGPTLKTELARAPKHNAITILATSAGKPWTYNRFSTVWHRFKKKLEAEGVVQPGLTPKGLRHTVATTLREAGLDERQIADLLGQKTPAMARHYSRSANLADRNRITMETLEKENEHRLKVVKPFKKTVKP